MWWICGAYVMDRYYGYMMDMIYGEGAKLQSVVVKVDPPIHAADMLPLLQNDLQPKQHTLQVKGISRIKRWSNSQIWPPFFSEATGVLKAHCLDGGLWQTWSRKLRPAPTLGGVRFVPRALACQRHHQRLTWEMRLFVGVNWWARVVYLASFHFFFETNAFPWFLNLFRSVEGALGYEANDDSRTKRVFWVESCGKSEWISKIQSAMSMTPCPSVLACFNASAKINCLAKCRIWSQDPTRLVVMGTRVTLWYTRWLCVGEKSTVFKFGMCP